MGLLMWEPIIGWLHLHTNNTHEEDEILSIRGKFFSTGDGSSRGTGTPAEQLGLTPHSVAGYHRWPAGK